MEATRKEQVAQGEALLAELLECAEWHKANAADALRGAAALHDPLLRFAWGKMADEHSEMFKKINRIVADLRFQI